MFCVLLVGDLSFAVYLYFGLAVAGDVSTYIGSSMMHT